MTDIFFACVALASFALCLLALLRNEIVFEAVMRRIDEVHEFNMAQIRRGKSHDLAEYDDKRGSKYGVMIFDIRKWTYRQFFPERVGGNHESL